MSCTTAYSLLIAIPQPGWMVHTLTLFRGHAKLLKYSVFAVIITL